MEHERLLAVEKFWGKEALEALKAGVGYERVTRRLRETEGVGGGKVVGKGEGDGKVMGKGDGDGKVMEKGEGEGDGKVIGEREGHGKVMGKEDGDGKVMNEMEKTESKDGSKTEKS